MSDSSFTVTDDHFTRATEKAVQNPVHSDAVSGLQTPSDGNETAVSPAFAKDTAVAGSTKVPPRGVEDTRFAPSKTKNRKTATPDPTLQLPSGSPQQSPAASGAGAESPDWVQRQIASLPPEVIAALWTIFSRRVGDQPPETSR